MDIFDTQLKKSWECNRSIERVTLLYQRNSDFTLYLIHVKRIDTYFEGSKYNGSRMVASASKCSGSDKREVQW